MTSNHVIAGLDVLELRYNVRVQEAYRFSSRIRKRSPIFVIYTATWDRLVLSGAVLKQETALIQPSDTAPVGFAITEMSII